MMPDLFGWLLTGERVSEFTDASTTQLLDARQGSWSSELCRAFELPYEILPTLIKPGTELAPLRKSVQEELGISRHRVGFRARNTRYRQRGRRGAHFKWTARFQPARLVLPQLGYMVLAGRRGSVPGDHGGHHAL